MSNNLYEEIMKTAANKCIDDGEYCYESVGFKFSDGANEYMNEIGALAAKLCHMLDKEYIIDD